jgi:hypothetical protein
VGERLRTTATETKTETTLMIMLPMGDATSMPRGWESRTASVPNFASVPCIIAGDRAWLSLACSCVGCPSLTGQDCGRVLRDFTYCGPTPVDSNPRTKNSRCPMHPIPADPAERSSPGPA